MPNTEAWAPKVLAILRIVAALLLLEHATVKFFHFPMAMPMPGPLPPMIVAAGIIELVGGILLTIGLFTRPVAFIASGLCAAAYFIGHFPKSFWPVINQGEPAILFCFIFLYLAAAGPGSFAVNNK